MNIVRFLTGAVRSVMVAGAILSAGCAQPSVAQSPDYAGVYVTSRMILPDTPVRSADDVVRPEASGTFIRIAWNVVEPRAGQWDWREFDAIAVPAIRAGKRLSVGLIAGTYAPDWLGDELGAKYSLFTIEQIGCRPARIYWPWDQTYQKAYLDLMRALADHLRAINGYGNLAMVKNSFIAAQTLELRLPRRAAGTYEGCRIGDLQAEWVKAGYRPSLVLDSYRRVMQPMANSIFPDKIISQPTQRGGSFPNIDEQGRRVRAGSVDDALVESIISACNAVAKRRCSIQNQSLQSVGPMGDRVLAAKRQGSIIGWQSAMFKRRSRCVADPGRPIESGMKKLPPMVCSHDQYADLLRRATDAGATYLELYAGDVRDYPDVIRTVDAKLRANARADAS